MNFCSLISPVWAAHMLQEAWRKGHFLQVPLHLAFAVDTTFPRQGKGGWREKSLGTASTGAPTRRVLPVASGDPTSDQQHPS